MLPLSHPIAGKVKITSPFGPRTLRGITGHHNGIDYSAVIGTPVHACRPGTVVRIAYEKGGAGYYVVIRHDSVVGISDDDGTIYSLYMHLSKDSFKVKAGDMVSRGQHIADSGNSGYSTGAHLHFEVRMERYSHPFDPVPYLEPNAL